MTEIELSVEDPTRAGTRRMNPEEGIARWLDVMDACEQFLLTGLSQNTVQDGDLVTAYRKWYARQMAEHDKMIHGMIRRFSDSDGKHVG